jgi:hypothetical protein
MLGLVDGRCAACRPWATHPCPQAPLLPVPVQTLCTAPFCFACCCVPIFGPNTRLSPGRARLPTDAGVILFILLGGYPPFYDDSEPKLFEKIR